MIWLIVFVFICDQIEQFNCASQLTDRKVNFDETSEYDDLYWYELTPSSLDGSELLNPLINDTTGTLKKYNITNNQPGIPFHLIIRLVNARTSKPLAGAYVYVWHVNINGNYLDQNGVGRSRRFDFFEENFEEFQGKENDHDRPWKFNNEPDHGRMFEPHLRQDFGRSGRQFPPPNERPKFELKEAFNGPKSREPFRPIEFNGSPYNRWLNNFSESYGNTSIPDSNSSHSSNNFQPFETTKNSLDSENFTQTVSQEMDRFSWHQLGSTESIIEETTPKSRDLENSTEADSSETTPYSWHPFVMESATDTYSYNDSSFTMESVNYEAIFSNLTKVNVTSNHTVEQKPYANETRRQFLQGYQITDFKGDVSFVTIVPGWIANRSLHVNVHVYLDKSQETATFVGQLYFPNEFADKLKSVAMYSQANRLNLTKNYQDKIFKSNNGNSTVLKLETIGSGYQSIITLGIDPLKTIKP